MLTSENERKKMYSRFDAHRAVSYLDFVLLVASPIFPEWFVVRRFD